MYIALLKIKEPYFQSTFLLYSLYNKSSKPEVISLKLNVLGSTNLLNVKSLGIATFGTKENFSLLMTK